MMKWRALVVVIGLGLAGVARGQTTRADDAAGTAAAGHRHVVMQFGGFERSYEVHAPQAMKGERFPLLVVLHGGGGTGVAAMVQGRWARKAEEEGFIAVFPDALAVDPRKPQAFKGNPQVWNDGSGRGTFFRRPDDVGFIAAVVDELKKNYPVDEERVYATGFSNGASMTFRLAAELAGTFAAVAPVSGHLWVKDAKPERPVPALFMVGMEDPLNPINGGPATNPWNARGEVKPAMQASVDAYLKMMGLAGAEARPVVDKGAVHAVRHGKAGGVEFVYYKIDGMGHTWPGGIELLPESMVGKHPDAVAGTDLVWRFLRSHRREKK